MFLVNMALKHFLVGQNIERLSVDFSVGLSSSVPAQPRTAATQFLAEKENLKRNFNSTATDFQHSFKKNLISEIVIK